MRVAVVGSRDYPDMSRVRQFIGTLPKNATVVSGGARGPDTEAEREARARGLKVEVYLPDWSKHARAAGVLRNQTIVDNADLLVAFWDGRSRGTADALQRARKKGLPVAIVYSPSIG